VYFAPSRAHMETEVQGPTGYRDAGIARASGETDAPRAKYNGRPTDLLKNLNGRSPSPVPAPGLKGRGGPGFGFQRPTAIPSATTGTPTLRNKPSRNDLRRRKPFTVTQNTTTLTPTPSEIGSSMSPVNKWTVKRPGPYKVSEAQNRNSMIPDLENHAFIIPELDRYRSVRVPESHVHSRSGADVPHKLATPDPPPPTPLGSGVGGNNRYSAYSGYSGYSGYSASPSTRYSESPGPGAYSRDTTPTSMSSQSPGIAAPVRLAPRLRQNSPITGRLPLGRRRAGSTPDEVDLGIPSAQGLPPVRESLTSSSSNSTVRGSERGGQSPDDKKKKKKKGQLLPLPPSPPLRKSSQHFKKSHATENEEAALPLKAPLTLHSLPPAGMATDESPLESPRMRSPEDPQLPSKGKAPLRPSRDGAPDLQEQFEESTRVIHSNLAGIHFSRDRRKSSSVSPTTDNKHLPRLETNIVPSGLGIVPDLGPDTNRDQQQRHSTLRTPSPSTATPKYRLGFFGRRTKTTPEPVLEQKERRKGPAAGTGHEVYGRFVFRGRSGSIPGRDRSNSTTSSSHESINSNLTNDQFLLERMSPVIIAGGGEVVENRNTSFELSRTDSRESPRPSLDWKLRGPGLSISPDKAARATLWPSAMPRDPVENVVSKGGSLTSDNGFIKKPALSFRQSIQRLRLDDQSSLNLLKPVETIASGSSPAISSSDTNSPLDDVANQPTKSSKGSQHKKLSKRPPSPRKWNFFQRSQTSAKSKNNPDAILPVVVAQSQVRSKPLPFYAMIDSSEQVGGDAMDFEDILREVEVFNASKAKNPSGSGGHHPTQSEDTLDPSPDMPHPHDGSWKSQVDDAEEARPVKVNVDLSGLRDKQAQNFLPEDEHGFALDTPSTENGRSRDQDLTRPSRLPQVGRIPRVVTARPYLTSPKSFSRPFARIGASQPLPNMGVVDQESIALGPSPEISPGLQRIIEQAPELPGELPAIYSDEQPNAFLDKSARKNSEATTTTSSSSGTISYAGTTAVIPKPGTALGEDEIWGEYDDLIWDGSFPSSSSSYSPRIPSQYEKFECQPTMDLSNERLEPFTATIFPPAMERNGAAVPPRLWLTSSSVYSPDLSASTKNALSGLPTPTSPSSFTDLFASYGDRNNSIISGQVGPTRFSTSQSHRDSASTSAYSKHESSGERRQQSTDSRLVDVDKPSRDSSTAQVNLRIGSMTVSKWLTFGHVLFSPACGEAEQNSILVIDGLGNDDWSFYAAETYPKATFYNLSSTPSSMGVSPTKAASFPQSPINHRQVQYQNYLDKFPFPRDMFTTVVLRFPAICSDTAIRNLISESKRVLKPTGYLEMSILDLDMLNMGNRTRRAIRDMKIKLTGAEPPVSLASTSDTVLRVVGKRGFEDVKSCKVGVPVASTVIGGTSPKSTSSEEKDISLTDMMNDESDAGDVGITKMVARVGRWWFLRCYEMAVLPNGDTSKSIFADATLLKECEKWNTSFKLLVCYAQKPVVPRRRTAPV